MSFKEKMENNLAVTIGAFVIGAFVAGWTARGAIISVSGQEILSKAEISDLKLYANLGKEDLVKRNLSLKERVFELETKLASIEAAEPEDLVEISNVRFLPQPGSQIKAGENVKVTFDYKFKEGIKGSIWAFTTDKASTYSPSKVYSSEGTFTQSFSVNDTGWINTVDIFVKDESGKQIKRVTLPARYEFI